MKLLKFIIVLLLFISCDPDYDDSDVWFGECKTGTWQCKDNKSQYCTSDEYWKTYQDCTEINETCIYNQPDIQGGYTLMSSCEE